MDTIPDKIYQGNFRLHAKLPYLVFGNFLLALTKLSFWKED